MFLGLEPTMYRFSDYLEKLMILIKILYTGTAFAAVSIPFTMKILTGNFV